MVFQHSKSPTPPKEHSASASTATVSVIQKEADWISNALRVAELASAVGSLLPFPYLRGAAELVKILLKPIQQMQQNQDGYKTLTVNVTTILQILHDTKDHGTASDLFKKDCKNFCRYLKHIVKDLQSFNKPYKSKFLGKYFAADREKELLARHQSRIEEFRNNLVLRGVIRLQIASNTDDTDSDFEKIRLGDLNVLKHSLNGQVEHWEVRWKQESQTRLVRVYKGRDAISKFKAEKKWYSRYRHPSVMQLYGFITSKESPGLVFYSPWCIPFNQFDPRFSDALGQYMGRYCADMSFYEGLQYLEASVSHHAILAWRDLQFSCNFICFKDREDGYLVSCYVNVLDGRGLVIFEWSPNILQDIPACPWHRVRIGIRSPEETIKIMEKANMLRLSQNSDVPSDPSFLCDIYTAIGVFIWKDVSTPAYPVYTGYVLSADKHDDTLEASDAAILGFFPYGEPSLLDWFVRGEISQTKVTVEDCGVHFRMRVPVDTAGISATDDLQTVVVECDILYSDRAAWERLSHAYVSQIGFSRARIDGMRDCNTVCVVTGFSWHIQVPSRLRCSVETSGYKELYFFISKPAVRDETLDTYWSFDPSGSERLDCSGINTLGFEDSNSFEVQTRRTLRVVDIDDVHFEFIQHAHAVLGIGPESDEAAHILGLPLICPIQPDSDSVSDDSDQDTAYHTAEDEAENGAGHEAEGWIGRRSQHRIKPLA